MKKSIILAVLGLAGSVASSYAQGFIYLDNYSTSGPIVKYFDLAAGGPAGTGIGPGFTIGIYFAEGSVAVSADPGETTEPSSLGALSFSSFPNSTAQSASASVAFTPGMFANALGTQVNSAAGAVSTLEIVAYNGATFASSTVRGHSAAFQITGKAGSDPSVVYVGSSMPGFNVHQVIVPEPSTFALIGLGTGALFFFRRRK